MLLTRQQDPVGLVLFDEKANTILPPSATQSQILVMSGLLEKCQPARKTELGGLLLSLADQFRRRNLMVIVSDLFTDLDKLYDALNRLRFSGHEVLVMQVLDRDELELPFDGPTLFRDIEGDEELFAEPWAFRRSYQNAMNEFLESVRKDCGARGYDHVKFVTDESLGDSLSYFLHYREETGHAVDPGYAIPMMTFLSPFLIWGTLLGRDPPHHPPAEPAPVPPRGMGADALPQADDSAQPAADPARAALAACCCGSPCPCCLFFFLARPVINPTGLEQWLGTRRPVQPGRLDRRLDEHGLHVPARRRPFQRACRRRPDCWRRSVRKTIARW